MADVIDRGVIEIVGDARKLKASIEDAKKSIRTLGEGQRDISRQASASIDKYVGSLIAQSATLNKTAREQELYRLALRGASDEQLKAANIALRTIEAHQKTEASLRSLGRAAAYAATAIATGFAAAVVGFELLIGKAASFQDLSEKVGDSAENIAALSVAAAVGGSSIESTSQAIIKLQKNLTGVDDEAEAAGAALSALGINIAAFKQLSPTEQFRELAKALDQFEDSGQKAAVVQALLGKEGASQLPVLKELAAETEKQITLTNEQIKLADDYKDAQTRLRKQFELQAIVIATEMLPAYDALQKAFIDTIKQMVGIEDGASDLANSQAIKDFAINAARSIAVVVDGLQILIRTFQIVGKSIAGYAAAMDAVQRLDFRGAIASTQALGEDIRAIFNKPLFSTNLEARLGEIGQTNRTPPQDRPDKRRLDFQGAKKKAAAGGADDAAALARAQLQFDLEQIRASGAEQADAFRRAESIMQALRSASLVDDRDYFASKLAFIQTFAREDEAALQAQIERRQREVFTGKTADKDRLDNDREIIKLQAQIAKIRADAVAKTQINAIEEQAALRKIQQSYIDAKVAAEAYLDTIARRNAREIEGVGRGQRFREVNAGRGEIDDRAQAERRRLEGELRRQQISREQFDQYLAVVEDTYRREVEMYEERTDTLERLQGDWLNGATEALNNYIDKTRDIAKQTEDLFTNAFQGIEDALVEFSTTGKLNFKKLADSIVADITRMQIRQNITGPLAEWLKGDGNGPSWLEKLGEIFTGRPAGGFPFDERLPKIPRGIGGAGVAAANAAQFSTAVTTAGTTVATTLTTAGTTLSAEITSAGAAFAPEIATAGATFTTEMTASGATLSAEIASAGAAFGATVTAAGSAFAASVAAGAATEGAGDAIGGLGSLAGSFLGSFQSGIPFVPRNGLAMLHQGERVVPASENRGGTHSGDTINIVNNWAPGTDRRTVDYAVGEMERRIGLRRRGMSV